MLLLLIVCLGISNRLAAVVSLDLPHQHAMLHFVNFNVVGFCRVSNVSVVLSHNFQRTVRAFFQNQHKFS